MSTGSPNDAPGRPAAGARSAEPLSPAFRRRHPIFSRQHQRVVVGTPLASALASITSPGPPGQDTEELPPTDMPFSIIALATGVTRLALEGDLDALTVEGLRPELLGVVRRRPTRLEVDLSRLRSVDPRGMQVLVAFFAGLTQVDCRITVTGIRDQPLKPFKTALFDAILNASQLVN